MERDRDPALNFFPEGEVDLYAALGVEATASADEIKKAYRKLALRFHPDKVLSAASTSDIDPHKKFQQINFAYGVVSDEKRRKRYDDTGRTDEPMFMEDGFSWDDYFKEMWQGNVSGSKLDEFKLNYQNSDEERADVLEAYETAAGDLETMFTLVPCSEVLEDETRFVKLITDAISAGELKELPQWKRSVKDEAGRKKMRAKARSEANEAEEYAKELGVWDDLFGKGKNKSSTGNGKERKRAKPVDGDDEVEVEGDASSDEDEGAEEDEDEDEPVQKKRRTSGKGKAATVGDNDDEEDIGKNASSSSAKKGAASRKGKEAKPSKAGAAKKPKTTAAAPNARAKGKKSKAEAENEDDGGLDGLRALMMKRGADRSQGFDAMIARLESQAGESAGGKGKKGKGKGSRPPPMFDDPLGEDEPDEAAFLAAREKIDANKKKSDAGKAKKSR